MTDPVPADDEAGDNDPAAILFQLLVTLLTPLFLTGSASKIDFARARLAASATLDGYHAMTIPELISVAQIIGFSLTTLGSLALSMADDLSTSMLLRLRGNANALSRSEQSHQKTLEQSRRRTAELQADRQRAMQDYANQQQQAREAEKYGFTDAAIAANVAEAQKLAAEAHAAMQAQPTTPAPEPARQAPSAAAKPQEPKQTAPSIAADPLAAMRLPRRAMTAAEDHQRNLAWGTAMAAVAAEFAADHTGSPREQRLNAIRASALSSAARQLLGGASTPPAESHTSKSAEPPLKT